jgi:hypothetical protein
LVRDGLACHDGRMAYRIEFYREGAVVDDGTVVDHLPNAKHVAERALQTARNDADFARVIDLGSGFEVASIRRDTMVWDDA